MVEALVEAVKSPGVVQLLNGTSGAPLRCRSLALQLVQAMPVVEGRPDMESKQPVMQLAGVPRDLQMPVLLRCLDLPIFLSTFGMLLAKEALSDGVLHNANRPWRRRSGRRNRSWLNSRSAKKPCVQAGR